MLHRFQWITGLFGLLLVIVWINTSQAQTQSSLETEISQALGAELSPPDRAARLALESPHEKPFNIYAGMDIVSMYISRGLVYSSKASAQPWVELDVPIHRKPEDSTSPINHVSWFIGNWNSLQEGDAGLGQARSGRIGIVDNWYEADVYSGVRINFLENIQTSLRMNWYTSPSSSFKDIYEIDFRVMYNDADFWNRRFDLDGFSTTPALRVAKEFDDRGGPDQWFFKPSLTPSFPVNGLPFDATVSIPLVLGFGADGQYREVRGGRERHFGFVQTGLGLDIPMKSVTTGSLSYSTGFDVIVLPDKDLSFRDEQVEFVAKMGIAYSY